MAEVVEQVLIQVNLENNQLKTELVATKDRVADLRGQVSSANDVLKELQKNSEKNAVAISNQKEKIIEINSALQAEVKNQNALQLALTKTEQANRLEAGSLAQKRAALAAGQTAYAQYSAEQKETDENAIKLAASLGSLKKEILAEADAIGSTTENVGNYKAALSEAIKEAQKLRDEFGAGSKEAEAAAKNVSNIKQEIKDFNDRTAAMTVEGKLQAITKGAAGIAGGFAAASGAAALFGGDADKDIGKLLVKLQALQSITVGLKEFAELPGTLKALGLMTKASTVATAENTVATEVNTVSKATNTTATEGMIVVQQNAIVTSAQLGVALNAMLGPLGWIAIGVAAVVTAFSLLSDKDLSNELDNIAKAAEDENEVHEKTVDILNQISETELKRAENVLAVAEAEGKSSREIQELQSQVSKAKSDALVSELSENDKHYKKIDKMRDDASKLLLQDLDDEETEKAKKIIEGANKEIDAINKRYTEISIAQEQINNEKKLQEIKAEQDRQAVIDEAASIRVQGIKNNREKEIAVEKLALDQRLRELLKDEEKNGELIYELRDASARRISEINLKYDIQAQDDRNKLAVLKTAEGTEARLEAERNGIVALRNLQLRAVGLTENQKRIIIAESNQKIFDAEEAFANARINLQDNELKATRARQIAILEARKANATTPTDAINAEVDLINQKFQDEIASINKGENDKVAALERSSAHEIELAKGNKEAIAQIESDKQTQLSIIRNTAEAERIKSTTEKAGQILQVTNKSKEDELSRERFLIGKRLSMIATESEEELRLKEELILKTAEKAKIGYENDAEARKAIDAKANQDIELARAQHVANLVAKGAELYSQLEGLSNIASQNQDIDNQNAIKREQEKNDQIKSGLKDQLDKGLIDQKAYDAKVAELDKQLNDKQNELKRQSFIAQKDADLIQAGINTALAVTRALATPPGFPLNAPSVVLTGALGLAQIALISQRPVPEFYDGGYTETGNPYEVSSYSNSTRILHKGPEHVSPYRMVVDPFTGPIISGLEDYRVGNSSTLKNMLGYFEGGFTPGYVPASISSPVFDAYAVSNAVIQGMANTKIAVSVEEINSVSTQVAVNESRASL